MAMTPLQSRLCDIIVDKGPSSAQQLADDLGIARSIAVNALTYGQSYGFFDCSDGSKKAEAVWSIAQ